MDEFVYRCDILEKIYNLEFLITGIGIWVMLEEKPDLCFSMLLYRYPG